MGIEPRNHLKKPENVHLNLCICCDSWTVIQEKRYYFFIQKIQKKETLCFNETKLVLWLQVILSIQNNIINLIHF